MLFNGLFSSLNKAMEYIPAFSNNRQEDYNDDDSSLDEKSITYGPKFQNNGVFGRLRRTTSNRSLFKNWSFSSSSVNSITTVSPPSPTQVAPLWKEQVDSNTKNGLHPSEIHRQEIMYEIIRTEKAFVDDMKYFIDHYVTEIRNSGIRLPPNLIKTFAILPNILSLHSNVSLQLRCIQAIMYPVVPSIAHILRDLATQLAMYESYLVHHKMAIAEIANARKKNNKLGQFIKSLEVDILPGRILTVESLLTKPFQRLCKYPLLVMTLLRATAPSHKDHAPLTDLYHQIDCALRELQERKSEYERSFEIDDFPRKFRSLGRFNKLASNGRFRSYSLPSSQ